MWSKQKEICQSVVNNRFTAVKSCHSVGKTAVAARVGCWFLSCHEPGDAFLVTSAPTGQQVRALLWREINQLHALGGLPGRTNATEWLFGNELVGFGKSVRDMNPTAFQGIHAPFVLVILDEAGGITHPIWTAAETLVANDDSRFLAIGNPDDPATPFGEVCRPGSGYNVIRISAFDSPNFTDEDGVPDWLKQQLVGQTWVEERRIKWGEDSPLWRSKVLGEFPEQSQDGLIPIKSLREAVARELEPSGDVELGVDVARFGLDKTVIYKRQGNVARKFSQLVKRDTMDVVWEIVRALDETKATAVKIDDIGLGGGVVDRLRELYLEGRITAQVVGINVSMKPLTMEMEERFTNRRAELNWDMRQRFMDGDIDIEDDDDLLAQATAMKYKMVRGKIQIVSKDDIKKLRMPSPDDWDALVLAFASAEYGVDMAFMEQTQSFTYEPFEIPKFWPRVYGLDVDGADFAAIWGAWDVESGVVYLYDEYAARRPDVSVNASAIRKRRSWIPGLLAMRDHSRSKEQAERLVWSLMDEHLNVFDIPLDQESAVDAMNARLQSQTLKVSKRLTGWLGQYAAYKRDKGGDLMQEKDGLLRASGLIVIGGEAVATTEAVEKEIDDDTMDTSTKDSFTGY